MASESGQQGTAVEEFDAAEDSIQAKAGPGEPAMEAAETDSPRLAREDELAQLRNLPGHPLRRMLDEEPFRVRFFQAVRLLQRIEQGRERVGNFAKPHEETIRFSSLPSLAFPPSELYDLQRAESGQLQLTVQFMGLSAALAALPTMYTQEVLARLREKDHAMADFFDIFNHRLISLFYRAWEKNHFYVGLEAGAGDKLTLRLLDVLGLGTGALRKRSVILDETCVYYTGLLGRHVRTATALRQILEDFFDVSVQVHQFAGTWRPLPRENQTFLSGFGTVSEQLGLGVVAGEEVWDQHGRIRITFGPLGFQAYQEFLPGQPAHTELTSFMKFYSDGAYETEVQLILKREDVPACELGTRGAEPPQLGLVSWLKTRPRSRDADEAMFLLPA